MSYETQVWKEILDAPIGATRLLGGAEYEKVQGPSGTTRWVNSQGREMTNNDMYERTVK